MLSSSARASSHARRAQTRPRWRLAGGGGGTDGPAGADRGAAAPRAREVLPLVGEGLGAQREPQTRSMPPKGKKAYRTDADLPADWSSVTIELRGGEKDPQNVAYHATILDAWRIVQGHPLFDGIDTEDPLSIAMGGTLAPFNQKELEQPRDHAYTCGINFSWVNLLYSATPGIPIRMAAVQEVMERPSWSRHPWRASQ